MDSIFHYTNAGGLKGIVDFHTIHASHYRFLNDPHEFRHARGDAKLLFIDPLISLYNNDLLNVDLEKAKELFSDQIPGDSLTSEKAYLTFLGKEVALAALRHEIDRLMPFLVSFSQHADQSSLENGLLNQWRDYGRDGGYAIGFDRQAIADRLAEENVAQNFSDTLLENVKYEEFNWDEKVIACAQNMAVSVIRKTDYSQALEISDQRLYQPDKKQLNELKKELFYAMTFVKNEVFRDERETRLAVFLRDDTSNEAVIDHKLKGGAIVPFHKLFGDEKLLPIKSVMVGPHPNRERRAEATKFYLNRAKYKDVEVLTSKISLTSQF